MRIHHDPGHGCDPAVEGVVANGIVERDTVYNIVIDIIAGLMNVGVDHVLLRKPDGTPDYTERAQKALQDGAKLVLCHHINSDADPKTGGTITFYDPGDALGQAMAQTITEAAPAALKRRVNNCFPCSHVDWTARTQWVLEHYRQFGLSCCLIEWGFASNVNDARFLLDPKCRPQIVAAAFAGIARAMELCHLEPLVCADPAQGGST